MLTKTKKITGILLAVLMMFSCFSVIANAADSDVISIVNESITPSTTSVTVNLTAAPSSGLCRIFQLDADEDFNTDNFFSYTALATIPYTELKVGNIIADLDSAPTVGSKMVAVLRAFGGDLSGDYASAPVYVTEDVQSNTSISFVTDSVTTDTTSVKVNITSLPSVGILRVVELDSDEDYDSSKLNSYTSLNFSLLSNLSEGENTLTLTSAPTAGKKILAVIRDSSGDATVDYTTAPLVVTGKTKTVDDILSNCSVTIKEDELTAGDTSATVKVQLDEDIKSCYVIFNSFTTDKFDSENSDNKYLASTKVTDGYEDTINFNSELASDTKVIAYLNIEVSEDNYQTVYSNAVEVKSAVVDSYTVELAPIDTDSTQVEVTLGGNIPSGTNLMVRSYPAGTTSFALFGGEWVASSFSVSEGKYTLDIDSDANLTAGDIVVAHIWSNAQIIESSEPVTVTKAAVNYSVELQNEITTDDTEISFVLGGNVPDDAMVFVKSFDADTTSYTQTGGTMLKVLSSVSAGTNTAEVSSLTEGDKIVVFLLVDYSAVAQSEPVTVKEAAANYSVELQNEITTSDTEINFVLGGNIPDDAMVFVKSFDANATSYTQTGGTMLKVLSSVREGTNTAEVSSLTEGEKIVVFLLVDYSAVAQSEPVTVSKALNDTEKMIAKTFSPDAADDNVERFKLGSDVEYSGIKLLGVQRKNNGTDSIRFVSVISSDLLNNAVDYGYVFTTTDKTTDTAKRNAGKLTVDNGHKYSCYGTYNTMTSGYGNLDSDTSYKYVTAAINNISTEKAVVARFYIETADGIFYADYADYTGAVYDGCAVRLSELPSETAAKED